MANPLYELNYSPTYRKFCFILCTVILLVISFIFFNNSNYHNIIMLKFHSSSVIQANVDEVSYNWSKSQQGSKGCNDIPAYDIIISYKINDHEFHKKLTVLRKILKPGQKVDLIVADSDPHIAAFKDIDDAYKFRLIWCFFSFILLIILHFYYELVYTKR